MRVLTGLRWSIFWGYLEPPRTGSTAPGGRRAVGATLGLMSVNVRNCGGPRMERYCDRWQCRRRGSRYWLVSTQVSRRAKNVPLASL